MASVPQSLTPSAIIERVVVLESTYEELSQTIAQRAAEADRHYLEIMEAIQSVRDGLRMAGIIPDDGEKSNARDLHDVAIMFRSVKDAMGGAFRKVLMAAFVVGIIATATALGVKLPKL